PETPLGEAFLAVYAEVDREMTRRSLALRATRLELVAQQIAGSGLRGIHTIWLDGFHALPDPELDVVRAFLGHAKVILTLTENAATQPTRQRLLALGFVESRLAPRRPHPAIVLIKAANMEREADEIARRILEQNRAGRPFREIGVIVRSPEIYAPLLRTT